MTNKKGTKRSLLMSALAMLLCVSMLIGSTFAWFTDSVTSAGNIIKSGTLDISMKWAKGTEDPAAANWQDASTTKIFNYDQWEPGYTEARHIAVKNEGTLALKYQLTIVPTGEVTDLADVIDVYYIKNATQLDERADMSAYTPVGTLAELIDNKIAAVDVMPNGRLAAGEGFAATLVLKMQESATNEYQNKSIGTDFAVKLIATQDTVETDSFDNLYDEDATYDGTVDNFIGIKTVEDLKTVLAESKSGRLLNDITWTEGNLTVPASTKSVIDLNGNDLTISNAGATAAFLMVNGDLMITGEGNVAVRQINASEGSELTLGEGVKISTSNNYAILNEGTTVIDGATIEHAGGNSAIQNQEGGTLIINNATVTSTNCNMINNNYDGTVIIYGGTFTHNGFGAVISDVYGGGTEIIINGGAFVQNGSDPLVNMGWSGKLTVNGGTFDAISQFCGYENYVTVNAGVFKNNAKVVDYFSNISSKVPATSTATTNADGSITVTVN